MHMILIVLLLLVLIVDLVLFYRLLWGLKYFTPLPTGQNRRSEDEWPTVTVCIPARNEKHAMTSCLEAVVASDYPKLEIIVLDDGSRDDTSLLIKSFAHAGVRFVEGKPLPEGWLGKNYALDTLLDQASGQYVLFMDVDTRIQPYTILRLVDYMLSKKADMVSVMPQRHDSWRVSTLFATMRFFWEVAWHRNTKPASVSTAWMIRRKLLAEDLGGMESYATATRVDSAVARTVVDKGTYRFLISAPHIGISYEKKLSSQLHTSVRLTFPALDSNWFRVLLAVGGLAIALLPYVGALLGLWAEDSPIILIAWLVGVLQIALYALFVRRVWPRGWILGAAVLPILLVMEIWIVFASALGYLQNRITWKGRPIATTVTSSTTPSENVS